MTEKREFGIVGLGKMGGNLGLQALEKGMRVVGSADIHLGVIRELHGNAGKVV